MLVSIIYAISPSNLSGQGNDIPILRGFEDIFRSVISIAIPIGGVILFIMLLLGGFKYITSGASPDKAEAAKRTITYAILGIVLLSMGYLILRLIAVFTGANYLLNFAIRVP
jgi:hypothetical protein